MEKIFNRQFVSNEKLLNRLTTLWGFSESALGGFLHLLKIPLRGMIICSNSVFIISLISYFSKNKKRILKATILVLLVKLIVSPYTPVSAYFAVMFQGVTGYLFYQFIKIHNAALFMHAVFAQIQSSLQKFFGLTIFFGMTFWESLDIYIKYVLEKSGFDLSGFNYSFSLIFVVFYVVIHIVCGLVVAYIAARSTKRIEEKDQSVFSEKNISTIDLNKSNKPRNKKRFWWQRKSGIILVGLFLLMAVLPLIDQELEKSITGNILYMITRAVIITLVWFLFLSPLIVKYLKKYLMKKESVYTDELNEILDAIPYMRSVLRSKWKNRNGKGIKGLPLFISDIFYTLLFISLEPKE